MTHLNDQYTSSSHLYFILIASTLTASAISNNQMMDDDLDHKKLMVNTIIPNDPATNTISIIVDKYEKEVENEDVNMLNVLFDFSKNIALNSKDLDPKFIKIVDDYFTELI